MHAQSALWKSVEARAYAAATMRADGAQQKPPSSGPAVAALPGGTQIQGRVPGRFAAPAASHSQREIRRRLAGPSGANSPTPVESAVWLQSRRFAAINAFASPSIALRLFASATSNAYSTPQAVTHVQKPEFAPAPTHPARMKLEPYSAEIRLTRPHSGHRQYPL